MSKENRWVNLGKEGAPEQSGTYICVIRGDAQLKFVNYHAHDNTWIYQQGMECKKVICWISIPEIPPEVRMNMLLKKAQDHGLGETEKAELSKLLLL